MYSPFCVGLHAMQFLRFLRIARPCAVVARPGWGGKLWWYQLLARHPPNWKAVCDHVDAAIVLSVDVVRVVL